MTRSSTSRADVRSYGRAAFSLIEVMVAVGLLAVIIVGLLAMFHQTQKAFRAGATQADVLEGIRGTTRVVGQDFQEVSAVGSNQVMNLAAITNGPVTKMLLPAGGSHDNVLQDIMFLRHVNDEWFGTTYQVADAEFGVGTLYRFVTNTSLAGVSNMSAVISRVTYYDNTNLFHRIADGVVHFAMQAYDTNGVLITSSTNANINVSMGSPFHYDYVGFYSNALPAYVDLEIGILEPKAVEQFRSRASDPVKARKYLQSQAGRIHLFKQRIALRSRPEFDPDSPEL